MHRNARCKPSQFKKNQRKAIISLIVFLALLDASMVGKAESVQPTPYSQYTYTLSYGQYLYISNIASERIQWSFSGSSPYVGLEAWIFDSNNFQIFDSGQSASGYKVSYGGYTQDSGTQYISKCDTWYFVLCNFDSDQMSTTVTVNVYFYGTCSGNDGGFDDNDDIPDFDFEPIEFIDGAEDWVNWVILAINIIIIILMLVWTIQYIRGR
jgi:hypothetical protein